MGAPSQVLIGKNLVFSICTHDPDTGVLTDASSAPAYRVYEDETAEAILTGTMALLDTDNTTGFYTEIIPSAVTTEFEHGKTYTIYIEATVNSDKGGICYSFTALTDAQSTILACIVDTVTNTHTPTTSVFESDTITEATADHFIGRTVIFTSGVLQYQAAQITDYSAVGGIGHFTVSTMTDAPSNNDTFVIV